MGETDSIGLRHQAQQCAITIEGPRSAGGRDLQQRLIGPVDKPLLYRTGPVAEGNVNRLVPVPFELNHRGQPLGTEATDQCARFQIFECCHALLPGPS
jgi:hypothetical protein